MKGLTFISGIIFTAFILISIFIVYEFGKPAIERMQCAATLEKTKSSFLKLDRIIQDSLSGRGARRVIGLNIERGKVYIDTDNDVIYWKYECSQQIYSPRVERREGNIVFGSNLETKAYKGICNGIESYILENEHLKACFRAIGSKTNYTFYNTSELLVAIYQKDFTPWKVFPLSRMEIILDNRTNTSVGNGYTELVREGSYLPYGEVVAYMESLYGVNYYIYFTLESGADFITIRSSG